MSAVWPCISLRVCCALPAARAVLNWKVRNLGGDTTESLTNPLPDLLRLDKLITTDAVNVGTHGGQRVHDELVVVVAATATAIPAAPVIISTPPSGTRYYFHAPKRHRRHHR
jgi:hypothetical protein